MQGRPLGCVTCGTTAPGCRADWCLTTARTASPPRAPPAHASDRLRARVPGPAGHQPGLLPGGLPDSAVDSLVGSFGGQGWQGPACTPSTGREVWSLSAASRAGLASVGGLPDGSGLRRRPPRRYTLALTPAGGSAPPVAPWVMGRWVMACGVHLGTPARHAGPRPANPAATATCTPTPRPTRRSSPTPARSCPPANVGPVRGARCPGAGAVVVMGGGGGGRDRVRGAPAGAPACRRLPCRVGQWEVVRALPPHHHPPTPTTLPPHTRTHTPYPHTLPPPSTLPPAAEWGYEYRAGTELRTLTNVTSPFDCCQACAQDDACGAWVSAPARRWSLPWTAARLPGADSSVHSRGRAC